MLRVLNPDATDEEVAAILAAIAACVHGGRAAPAADDDPARVGARRRGSARGAPGSTGAVAALGPHRPPDARA